MKVILKYIPSKTTPQDIRDFIKPVVKGNLFFKAGHIKSVHILSQQNIKTQLIQHHGLVDITPDSVAKRVITKLNRKAIIGKYILVSEYHTRDWHNDKRFNKAHSEAFKNRRLGERRGKYKNLRKEQLTDTIKPADNIVVVDANLDNQSE
jgi:hypothetical protein